MAVRQGSSLDRDEAVAYALGEVTWDELAPVVAERQAAGEGAEAAADEDAITADERFDPADCAGAT